MTHIIDTLLLAMIEGVTECLPVSSTAHLLIAERWLGARPDLFNVMIQAGAILGIAMVYRKRIGSLLTGWHNPVQRRYLLRLGLAFLVTCLIGLGVDHYHFRLPHMLRPVAFALLIGGVFMLSMEYRTAQRSQRSEVSWTVAFLIGVAQIVAGIFPGTSRLGATVFTALLFGRNNRMVATEFSFLVGLPTMCAATGYELLKAHGRGAMAGQDWGTLMLGTGVTLVVSRLVVQWLLDYIRTRSYRVFAVYRIVLGGTLLLFIPDGG